MAHAATIPDAAACVDIILMGLRGSGKTSVSAAAAARLGLPASARIDLDDLTLRRLGAATIADAWRAAGEPAFREAEAASLRGVLQDRASTAGVRVIALGGGTPTAPGAAEALRDARASGSAVLVYLRASPSTLRVRLARAAGDAATAAHRPSLTGRGTIEEIEDVHAARDPLYVSLADHVVDASADVASAALATLAAAGLTPRR